MTKNKKCTGIGKSGCTTSWIVRKSLLKKIVGGSLGNCQDSINKEIDGKEDWLQLVAVLQNIKGKGIATMVGKIETNDVVVKVQMAGEAQKEIDVQKTLSEQNGFIKYYCDFTCDGDKEYIERFSTVNEKTRLCGKVGDGMRVIIMPYYRMGSLESVMKTLEKDAIKNILSTVIRNYADAYLKHEFTHGDFFGKNIVLDEKNTPIIIDFEKSAFKKQHKRDIFWNDLDNLLLDVSQNQNIGYELYDKARTITIHRAYGTEPTAQVIGDLVLSIESL